MNIAILIIVFVYVICSNIPNNVYGINCLDAFIIINLLVGFVYGFVTSHRKRK